MAVQHVLRVILAGGRRMLRESVASLLEKDPKFCVLGQATEPLAAIKLVEAMDADAVVLLSSVSGTALQQLIRDVRERSQKEVAVVVAFGSPPDQTMLRQVISAGAMGCLAKESPLSELLEAIEMGVAGKCYLSPQLSTSIMHELVLPQRSSGKIVLGPREKEVLRLLVSGQSAREIASSLQIATKTVDTHRRRIMNKLQKHSLPELTKYAIREGITSLESSE